MADLTVAALGLGLSDREVRCPRKADSVMAMQRCEEMRAESTAACAAKACPIVVGQPAPPPVEALRRPAPARIPAALRVPRPAPPAPTAAAVDASPPPEPTPAPPAEKETSMAIPNPAYDRALDAMRAEPERVWTIAELAESSGAEAQPLRVKCSRWVEQGVVERVEAGRFRIAGAAPATPKKKTAKERTAKAVKQMAAIGGGDVREGIRRFNAAAPIVEEEVPEEEAVAEQEAAALVEEIDETLAGLPPDDGAPGVAELRRWIAFMRDIAAGKLGLSFDPHRLQVIAHAAGYALETTLPPERAA